MIQVTTPPFPSSKSDMQKVMDLVFQECGGLREAGQAEYAHDNSNAFANFERTAAEVGIDRKLVLWIFAMKHKDGIASFLKGHESQREDVFGRVNDMIVYLILLRGMIMQERAALAASVDPAEVGGDVTVYNMNRFRGSSNVTFTSVPSNPQAFDPSTTTTITEEEDTADVVDNRGDLLDYLINLPTDDAIDELNRIRNASLEAEGTS